MAKVTKTSNPMKIENFGRPVFSGVGVTTLWGRTSAVAPASVGAAGVTDGVVSPGAWLSKTGAVVLLSDVSSICLYFKTLYTLFATLIIMSAILGASLTIPIENANMVLGTWQRIVSVNLVNS